MIEDIFIYLNCVNPVLTSIYCWREEAIKLLPITWENLISHFWFDIHCFHDRVKRSLRSKAPFRGRNSPYLEGIWVQWALQTPLKGSSCSRSQYRLRYMPDIKDDNGENRQKSLLFRGACWLRFWRKLCVIFYCLDFWQKDSSLMVYSCYLSFIEYPCQILFPKVKKNKLLSSWKIPITMLVIFLYLFFKDTLL